YQLAPKPGRGTPSRSADRAGAVSAVRRSLRRHERAMSAAGPPQSARPLRGKRRAAPHGGHHTGVVATSSPKVKIASAPLPYGQVRWLAALLLCAQVPLWG